MEEAPRWRDIWDLCPPLAGSLTIDRLFELCPPTAPRFYSISSSLLASPTEVALTVGQLAYQLPNGEKRRVRCLLRHRVNERELNLTACHTTLPSARSVLSTCASKWIVRSYRTRCNG